MDTPTSADQPDNGDLRISPEDLTVLIEFARKYANGDELNTEVLNETLRSIAIT